MGNHARVKMEQIKQVAESTCPQFGVKRLDAFGSMARGAAQSSSDVDLLVEFSEKDPHLTRHYFGLLHSLEDSLGCQVDLLTSRSLKNPYFRNRVLRERMLIYEG